MFPYQAVFGYPASGGGDWSADDFTCAEKGIDDFENSVVNADDDVTEDEEEEEDEEMKEEVEVGGDYYRGGECLAWPPPTYDVKIETVDSH